MRPKLRPWDHNAIHRAILLDILLQYLVLHAASEAESYHYDSNIAARHAQHPFDDVRSTLQQLRQGLWVELYVLLNGTTRLLMDQTRFVRLRFHMLVSSELVFTDVHKPEAYLRALNMTRLKPEEMVMVSSLADHTEVAGNAGLKTMYVRRDREVRGVDQGALRDYATDAYFGRGMWNVASQIERWIQREA